MKVLAIIPAAGAGVRMGGETPKQFLSIDGVSIVVHTLRKFNEADSIEEIYLGVRPDDMERAHAEIQREQFSKVWVCAIYCANLWAAIMPLM